jgi:hypothetical protein
MAIQKVSDVDKGDLEAVSGVAKTSIQAISKTTADFVTYDSIVRSVAWGDYPSHPLSGTMYGGYRPSTAYDSDVGRVVVGWQEVQSPHEPMIIVGTLAADGSVTYGSEIRVDSTTKGIIIDMVYNPNSEKIQIVWGRETSTNYYKPCGAEIDVATSGNTATVSSATVLSDDHILYGKLAYDEDTASMYFHWVTANDDDVHIAQLLDDGSALNGFDANPWTGDAIYPAIVYAKSIDRMLVACRRDSAGYLNVGTMSSSDSSGQDVTFGTSGGFEFSDESPGTYISIAWDETNGKGIVVYRGTSDVGKFKVFTVDAGNHTISFPTETNSSGTFESNTVTGCSVMWNENEGHFLIVYRDDDSNEVHKLIKATIGGTNNDEITLGTARTFAPLLSGQSNGQGFHTYQNHIKQTYISAGSKGSFVALALDHYADINTYRLSAQGTDYTNDV